jgi:two-component system CheB/CheR fusion protein
VHPEEFAYLFNTLLINVTTFFRDAPAWEYVSTSVLPRIVAGKGEEEPIRVWSAGCASGEEAYTVAMTLAEAIGVEAFQRRVKIYATDIDEEALAQARQAAYRPEDLKVVSPELREKYFELANGRYVFQNDLRRSIIFGRHDLVQDAPISRLDMLVCRNTLMYFNAETQARILARLHFALNDEGFLFLGRAEMLLTHANLFTPVALRHRVFRKSAGTSVRDRLLALAQAGHDEAGSRLAQQVRLRDRAFDAGPAAQVVVDANNNLSMVNQQACAMFVLTPRDLGRRFCDLEVSYRPVELRSCIEQVHTERRVISLRNVERSLPSGEVQHLDVQVIPLSDNGGPCWAWASRSRT